VTDYVVVEIPSSPSVIEVNTGTRGAKGDTGATGATGATGPAGPALNPTSVRYSPTFTATGMTFTGSGATYPTYNSYYVKAGQLVTIMIQVDMTTVTNFGTGQYKLQLPFTPLTGSTHFSGWIWRDPSIPADDENHIILNVDTAGVTNVLDLHFLVGATPQPKAIVEKILTQGAPGYNLTTVSKMYVNGTYISQS
jgi:hypothetical protein